MITVVFNNDEEFQIEEYNRSSLYENGSLVSTGFIRFGAFKSDYNYFYELSGDSITSLIFKKDNEVILTLNNLNARITSINEILTESDTLTFSINFNFN